jgi:glutaredoxin
VLLCLRNLYYQSRRAKHALTTANINFHVVELDQVRSEVSFGGTIPTHFSDHLVTSAQVAGGPQMQDALQTISGQRTIPNVFIKGHHVGGSDKVMAGLADGRINELMQSTSHKEL